MARRRTAPGSYFDNGGPYEEHTGFGKVLRHIKAGAVGVVIFPLALLALSFLAAQQGYVKARRAFRELNVKDRTRQQ